MVYSEGVCGVDYLLDSIVLLWYLRRKYDAPKLVRNLRRRKGAFFVSSLSVIEVIRGVDLDEEMRMRKFLKTLAVVPVDGEIAELAATYLRKYWPLGFRIDFIDATIAATAVVKGLALVTYNPWHYPMPEVKMYALY